MSKIHNCNFFFTNVLNKNAFRSPNFCYCYCYVVLPGHLSQHAKAATAEGLTFSDPIHKKSARNLDLYNFCHSAKKLTAVSPFRAVSDRRSTESNFYLKWVNQSTVYIETVSPLSTLNRYHVRLGVMLKMRRYCKITRVSLLLFIPIFFAKIYRKKCRFFL
jgi:hypothetical protein